MLGYHHQKWEWTRPEETSEEKRSENLLVRMEPSLKQWTIQHGGSELVRKLLKAERAKEQ